MKKTLTTLLTLGLCLAMFAGCNTEKTTEDTTKKADEEAVATEDVAVETKTVSPLPSTLDINNLDNCTVAVSLEEGDAYVDDTGKLVMDVTVYDYDLYDMVDIATLAENDTIIRKGEEVKVNSIERLDTGLININGGEENGGFSLISDDSTVYYEVGMSDAKAYYEIGNAILRVSADDFRYYDKSDLDAEPIEYYPGDFIVPAGDVIEYNFTPYNTTIVISDGFIVEMTKKYTP